MHRKGEISLGMLMGMFVTISIAVVGFFGNAINKVDMKAQGALDKTAELISIMKVTQNDVSWIKEQIKTLNQIPKSSAATSSARIAL